MLKAIKTGRPLVHLIKAWAIVGPHLIEVIKPDSSWGVTKLTLKIIGII